MAASLLMLLLAGTAGSLAPQPARAFAATTVRAGVSVGAMYYMAGAQVMTPPSRPAHPVPATP